MLKLLNKIFRFFVPTDDQVIARQIKIEAKSTVDINGTKVSINNGALEVT